MKICFLQLVLVTKYGSKIDHLWITMMKMMKIVGCDLEHPENSALFLYYCTMDHKKLGSKQPKSVTSNT